MDGAAVHFPDLSFEIVHAGAAFVEETAALLAWYPNIYANLEITSSFALLAPKLFESVMVAFMRSGGPQKIVFGDGGGLIMPSQPILEALMKFQFSDEDCEGYGIPKLTAEHRALILGGNYARIVGLDIEAAPYSSWKARHGEDGASA
jgi:predicted TIM-barrel fold metal-dependent hydrolase